MNVTASTRVALGCLALFLLPFAFSGLATGWMALQHASRGNWKEALLFSLFAVVFGGFGLGGLGLVQFARRKIEEEAALKASHPNQPWLWRKDWAAGRITDSGRPAMWAALVFTGFWNLISIPAGVMGVRAGLYQGEPGAFVALLFPLIGVGLLVWAIRTVVRYRKYGSSQLELSTLPGVVGHTVAGTVRVPGRLEPTESFEATLTCVRRVTERRGKNSSTTERILWQEDRPLRGAVVRDAQGYGTRIPMAFRIPPDAAATETSDSQDQIVWRLRVAASLPGVDYQSVFEVPVFRTEASLRPLPAEQERLLEVEEGDGYKQPAHSHITVTTNRRGTEIVFPAARNPGAAVGGTLFTLVWCGIVWVLIHFKAPVIFPVVFGLFGILLVYGMLQLWLEVSRVTIDSGKVSVARGYLSPGAERTVAAGEIAEVTTAIGMQAGSTPYYDIVIVRKNGRKVIAGRAVRDKREAEWLAATIREGLGHQEKVPLAPRLAS